MSTIAWKESYSVGVSKLDEQHKKLFSLFIRLLEAQEEWDPKIVLQSMEEMRDYASFHFVEEEEYMTESGYPDLEDHKKEHEQFRAKIEELCSERKIQPDRAYLHTIEYLYDWMTNHILVMDKQYGLLPSSDRIRV